MISHKLATTSLESLTAWLKYLREFELDNFFETRVLGRGYEYVSTIEVIDKNQKQVEAVSRGRAIYQLRLELKNDVIEGECSCLYERPCKHLAALILSEL